MSIRTPNTFNIGINTVWHNDFLNSGNDSHSYVIKTIDRLINAYKYHVIDKYNKATSKLNSKIKHVEINNDHNIFNNNVEFYCDCGFENSFDEVLFRAYDINSICHKFILMEIIVLFKNVTMSLNSKVVRAKNGAKTLKDLIMKQIIIGKNSDDPLLMVGQKLVGHYIIDKKLSNGSSGIIVLAKDIKSNKLVVLKISCANQISIDQLNTEYNKINILHEKNSSDIVIPKIIDLFDMPSNIWCAINHHKIIVLERYGSSLYDHLLNNTGMKTLVDPYNLQRIIKQLVKTIKFVNDCGIIHKDIKLSNILLRKVNFDCSEDDYDIVLIDYGISLDISDKMYTNMCGTVSYLSPEELFGPGYGKQVDVWCIGIIIVELIKGDSLFGDDVVKIMNAYKKIYDVKPDQRLPTANTYNVDIVSKEQFYEAMNMPIMIKNVCGLKIDANGCDNKLNVYDSNYFIKGVVDADLANLINSCLTFDPVNRITIDELINHEYMKKIINKSTYSIG